MSKPPDTRASGGRRRALERIDPMPQDSGPVNSRIGASCSREYPYAVQAPRPRPWGRRALELIGTALLATALGTGLGIVLVEWAAAPW